MIAPFHASDSERGSARRGAIAATRWFVHRSWAWLTLRPGSRPRRAMRRLRMIFLEFYQQIGLPRDSSDLSAHSRSVYAELKRAIAEYEAGC